MVKAQITNVLLYGLKVQYFCGAEEGYILINNI